MTLRVAVIGDLHFRESNEALTTPAWASIMKSVSQLKPDLIVLLGDFFDRFDSTRQGSFMRIYRALDEVVEIAPVALLKGNHECINDNVFLTDSSFLFPTKWNSRITLADKKAEVLVIKGYKLAFIPYVPRGRFSEALATTGLDFKEFKAIFSHQEFFGSEISSKNYSKQGDQWRGTEDGPVIINGHIHTYGRPQPNVINVGTPYQQRHDEKDEKFFHLYEFYPQVGGEGVGWKEFKHKVDYIHLLVDTITPERLPSYQVPVGYQVRLKIKASRAEWNVLVDSPVVQNLRNCGVSVELQPITTAPTTYHMARQMGNNFPPLFTFVEAELSNDPEALKEFRKFAGTI